MKKRHYILFYSLAIFFLLCFFTVDIARTINHLAMVNESWQKKPAVNLVVLEQGYKIEVKNIVDKITDVLQYNNLTTVQIDEIHSRLMTLRVPRQYMSLHVNLVFASDKLKEYLSTNDNNKKLAGEKLIQQAKLDNNWLN